jgi:DNA-binding XRE family transcriptional regulator
MINIIYGLRDPRNDVYQYIGKSTVGVERPLDHLIKSHSEKVNECVAMLKDKFTYPQIDIIEEVENIDDLSEREKYWIDYYYSLNNDLLNIHLLPKIVETRDEKAEDIFNILQSNMYSIPSILRKERMCRGLTQEEMAKHVNVSKYIISKIENEGNVSFKSVQKYFLTLKGLDVLSKFHKIRVRHAPIKS